MLRPLLGSLLLCGSLLVAAPSLAQGACTRAGLQSAVDSYIAAQAKGDPSLMPLASPVKYSEQRKDTDIKTGVLASPQAIDFHRSLLDTDTCQTFTEVVITDPKHPYVLGTRLKVDGGKVSEIETLVTDEGDWLFSAKHNLEWQRVEDWGVIPPAERADRASLIAAANSYFDLFMDKTVKVPWNTPCARLEGGLYTGKGVPDDSCDVGVPSGVALVNRRFVVDRDIGAAVGLLSFGSADGLPDTHLFRVENGKIRYVHTITVCATPNCGFPVNAELKARLQ